MSSITQSVLPPVAHHLKSEPDPPKKVEQAANFQTVMQGEILSPEQSSTGCHGHANELDMDAFFAAWGSTDSHYDVDANGIVDGGDLTILLAGQSDQPMAGSVDDVMQQWGVEGESTADLNADGIVDGADLVMALAGPPTPQESESSEQIEADHPTKLEALLADWGSDAARSDFTGDGIVDGLDLSFLLGGGVGSNGAQGSTVAEEASQLPGITATAPQGIIDPLASFRMESARAGTRDLGSRIFDQLQTMGFEKQPPRNLGKLIDAFKLNPVDSKALLSNVTDLFGSDGRKDIARG
jgi:hypothetical protein